MEKLEFTEAVNAWLAFHPSSWQKFIVEDHFDSFKHGLNILDLLPDAEVLIIKNRVYASIRKKIDEIE